VSVHKISGSYDVIIAGAGAAGLVLASGLSRSLRVLLLDKRTDPCRRIACAEWAPPVLPVKALNETTAMRTFYPRGQATKKWPGKIIDRERWQRSMLEELSCDVHLGENVERVEPGMVKTAKSLYRAGLVVGADGPDSIVRRCFGLETGPLLPAVNARADIPAKSAQTLVYFLPGIEKGYGWFFPRGSEANIGVGTTGNLKKTLDFFVDYLRAAGVINSPAHTLAAGFIPLYGLSPAADENVALVGDAAGLTDPLTGAGIYQAWDSGTALAKAINSGSGIGSYVSYIQRSYSGFLARRMRARRLFEDNWHNLDEAVERSWISFSRA
jgi:digeranylgeranylglycerophospholipid reductase